MLRFFLNSQEGKYRGVRITEDMSPGTFSKIKADRLHRKRANSRGWHCKFESAGVSWRTFFSDSCFHYVFCDVSQLGSEEGEDRWWWWHWLRWRETRWCIFFAWHSIAASSLDICHFDAVLSNAVFFKLLSFKFFGEALLFRSWLFRWFKRCETTWLRRQMPSWRMPIKCGRKVLSVLPSWLAVKASSCEMSQWP